MNFTKLREFLDFMAESRTPGCSVVVYKDGAKAFEYSAGVSSLESGEKMRGDELFNIYSCSKVATVTAAATLVERGIVLLSDPIYDYIPEFRDMKVREKDGTVRDAKSLITVGDLFSMTAGFNYNFNVPAFKKACELTNGTMDTATCVRCLADEPLDFDPGAHWQYSLCHDVLAGFVSIVTGMPFREYVKRTILEPLGMNDTYYHVPEELLPRVAEQYTFVPKGQSEITDIVEAQRSGHAYEGSFRNVGKGVAHILGSEYDSGGAGITTTVGDYAKLAAALANHGLGLTGERILAPATVELMKVNRLNDAQLHDFSWRQLRGYGYGLGVRTHMNKAVSGCLTSLGEIGWGGAAGATVIVDTDLRLGVFFVQHTLNPREEWYQPRLKNAVVGCLD